MTYQTPQQFQPQTAGQQKIVEDLKEAGPPPKSTDETADQATEPMGKPADPVVGAAAANPPAAPAHTSQPAAVPPPAPETAPPAPSSVAQVRAAARSGNLTELEKLIHP